MKKALLFFASACLTVAVIFTACNGNDPSDPKLTTQPGVWIESGTFIWPSLMDGTTKKCWAIDTWCDGTTIGRQYEWMTEAEVAEVVKNILETDLKVNKKQTKKVQYNESAKDDELSCTSQTWEGAKCWYEEVSHNGSQTTTNYGWMPEANMIERHTYYSSLGVTHNYSPAAPTDMESCNALNPQTPDDQGDFSVKSCWKLTTTIQSATTVAYQWATEAAIQAQVAGVQLAGGSASYEPASADDEYSCKTKSVQ